MNTTEKVVIITDASTQAAESVSKRLEKVGMRVIRNYPDGLPTNVAKNPDHTAYSTVTLESVLALSNHIMKVAGRLDALVHTDNVIFRASIEEISEDDFSTYVDRNAKSAFLCTKVLAQEIANGGGGSVVYLSSLHDEKPTGCAVAYSAGRGAIKMLSKEMALFFGRKNVRCNVVEMDVTLETELLLDSYLIPFNYDAGSKVALRKPSMPEDFAGTVAFLLSEDSTHINGTDIRIDGGHLLYYGDR